MRGELTLQEINDANLNAYPSVPISFIQSKIDIVQQEFYIAIGITSKKSSGVITPAVFYENITTIFGDYNKKHPNFVTYLVDGMMHCFTNKDHYYQSTCLGPFIGESSDNKCEVSYMLYYVYYK